MDPSQSAGLILRSFAALLVVTALAVIVLRFGLPWLMRQRTAGRARSLRVDDFYTLDRNHRLYVVSWEDSRILLATSPGRVQLLLARPEAAAAGARFEETIQKLSRESEPGQGAETR